jgi:hypothetical protein
MSGSKIKEVFSSVSHNIDDDMKGFTPLTNIRDKFGIKPSYVVIGSILIAIIFTMVGMF